MATKDWKKITNLSYFIRWENKKTAENLIMEKEGITSRWMVNSWKISPKSFKSKSLALTFAKSYMRSH